MSDKVRLVYAGEILDGFSQEDVKRDIGKRLKLEGAALDRLFAGKKVVVRREIERSKAERMISGLRKYGARFHLEAGRSNSPEATDAAAGNPAHAHASAGGPHDTDDGDGDGDEDDATHARTQLLEHVMCENCGEVQYLDDRCQACGAPLKQPKKGRSAAPESTRQSPDGFAVDTQGAPISTLMPPTPEMMADLERSRQAPAAQPEWSQFESPTFFSLSFRGRMGRLYFAIGGLLGIGALVWLGMALLLFPFWQVFYAAAGVTVLLALWLLRMLVLRLHDLGLRTFWLPLLAVPGLNVLALLGLMFWPGNKVFNRFGHPPMAANVPIGLAAVLLLAFDTFTIGAIAMEPIHRQDIQWDTWPPVALRDFNLERASSHPPQMPSDDELRERLQSAAAVKAFKEGYWPAPADRAFAWSPDGAFGWAGGLDDLNHASERALIDCRKLRRPYGPDCKVVHVNNIWTGRGGR